MSKTLVVLVSALALAACGKPAASKPTGAKVSNTAKSNTSTLKAQKPATATMTSTKPKAVPAAKTAGSTTVKAPELESMFETWSFTDVDLDGDGSGESGVIAADETRLLAWFSGAAESDGTTVSYEALVWNVPEGVGFIFDFGSAGALACGESASGQSGCVSCTSASECTEVGLEGGGSQ